MNFRLKLGQHYPDFDFFTYLFWIIFMAMVFDVKVNDVIFVRV